MNSKESSEPTAPNAADLDAVLHVSERSALTGFLRSQEFWIVIAILVIGTVVGIIAPRFLSIVNLLNILQNFSLTALMAIGMTPVIMAGGIDISVGSILGLCGVSLALMLSGGMAFEPAVLLTIVVGAGAGAINGALITFAKMPPFIVTLGTMSVFRSLTLVVSKNQVFYDFGSNSTTLAFFGGSFGAVPVILIAVCIAAVLMQIALSMTRWGRYVKAIGGNQAAATLTGIPVNAIKLSVYILMGVITGITSVFLLGWLGAATNVLGTGQELQVIAGSVIGGANLVGGYGSAPGAVVGSLLIEVIRNSLLLAGVDPFWQGTFVGGFIIFAVWFERLRTARQ
jgi:ribose transport system permease protein